MSKELQALIIKIDESHWETEKEKREIRYCIDKIKEREQRLEAIDNSKPSEALNYLNQFVNEMTYCLEHPKEFVKGYEKQIFWKYKNTFETTIKQVLLKAQEQEKENELLKEIIKKFFENGTPLFQYTNSQGKLMIEVSDAMPIFNLGKYKDIDLDKKLKEVIEWKRN